MRGRKILNKSDVRFVFVIMLNRFGRTEDSISDGCSACLGEVLVNGQNMNVSCMPLSGQ